MAQVDGLDTVAAAVAKDAQVQAAAVSLAKDAAAASGAYWAAAPTVRVTTPGQHPRTPLALMKAALCQAAY
jgi:hypothetical protein